MKKVFMFSLIMMSLFTAFAYAQQASVTSSESILQNEAAKADLQEASRQVFNVIQKIRRNLLDQITFYAEGRKDTTTHYWFTQLMGATPSVKLLQSPGRFEQGEKLATETWPNLPALAELRDYYLRSYHEFQQTLATELSAYKSGPMFWETNSELEKANQFKEMAFQDAAKAMEKTGDMLIQIGMDKNAPELKTLGQDLEELKKLQYDFLISGRQMQVK